MPKTLFLTPRYTPDSIALWRAATAQGWHVERLQSRAQMPFAVSAGVAIYGEPFFAQGVADALGILLRSGALAQTGDGSWPMTH